MTFIERVKDAGMADGRRGNQRVKQAKPVREMNSRETQRPQYLKNASLPT